MNSFGYKFLFSKENRILSFNKFNDDWKKFRTELPFRVDALTSIEDWSSPTGWNVGEATVLSETGEAGRLITASATVRLDKTFVDSLVLGKNFAIPIEVDNVSNFSTVTIGLATSSSLSHYYEINLYNQIKKSGTTFLLLNRGDFTVKGTPTWETIKYVVLKVYPAEGKTVNVKIGNIQTYDTNALCTVWFDDGEITQYTEAYTYMKTKGMAGTCSIISDYVSNTDPTIGPYYITREQMMEMRNCGWALVNHTSTDGNLTGVTLQEAEHRISKCLAYLLEAGAGQNAFHFTYPMGGTNADIDKIVKKYAISGRNLFNKDNVLPVLNPYALRMREVYNDTAVATVQGWIDTAIDNGTWLVLLFHRIVAPADSVMKVTPTDFKAIVDYLDTNKANIKVVTPSEALNY
jgi:peptidoglycan/xylan/chitin deacetylase (PgdA/CDA1 family)